MVVLPIEDRHVHVGAPEPARRFEPAEARADDDHLRTVLSRLL
jgi:hypothetical protein